MTVAVVDQPGQEPSVYKRRGWITDDFRTNFKVRVIQIYDINDDDNSEHWARYTKKVLGYTPDVVFTSEDYGDPWAYHLGCKHDRFKIRHSGEPEGHLIRENPYTYWDWMNSEVRSYYTQRIVIVGAESTGKTTLCKNLAKEFGVAWVPEYGRLFSEGIQTNYSWRSKDFLHIALQQIALEEQIASHGDKFIICDTDALATSIWHLRYMQYRNEKVDSIKMDNPQRIYLLSDVSLPFVQDGTRDGEDIRKWMHYRFIEEFHNRNVPFIQLFGGTYEDSFTQASHCIRNMPCSQ